MKCPRCKTDSLKKEQLEGVEVDRCPQCKGSWLDEGELGKIVNVRELKFDATQIKATVAAAFGGVPTPEKLSQELCPQCQAPMEAINYSYGSGIVIDRCFNNHGIWMDAQELDKAQIYIEHGEAQSTEYREEWMAFAKSIAAESSEAKDQSRQKSMRPTKYLVNSIVRKLLGG